MPFDPASGYHEDGALVEVVAEALYERAMAERRAMSKETRGFSTPWASSSERNKIEWRVDARRVLGAPDLDCEECGGRREVPKCGGDGEVLCEPRYAVTALCDHGYAPGKCPEDGCLYRPEVKGALLGLAGAMTAAADQGAGDDRPRAGRVPARPERQAVVDDRGARGGTQGCMAAESEDRLYVFAWANNERRAELAGRVCRKVARGAKGTVLVEFVDTAERVTCSFRALRRYEHALPDAALGSQ